MDLVDDDEKCLNITTTKTNSGRFRSTYTAGWEMDSYEKGGTSSKNIDETMWRDEDGRCEFQNAQSTKKRESGVHRFTPVRSSAE